MQHRDIFSSYHPVNNFLYFTLVLVFAMFFMHPITLGISLISSLAYFVYLKGRKAVRFSLLYMLPMILMAVIINPVFNHEGITILSYFPTGNPLTLESIVYGIAAACMLVSVIFWFSCFTDVMTSDKFVYLFGRVIPSLSLILSMTLRFIPKFKAQFRVVSEAQRCVGRDTENGGSLRRLKNAVLVLSIMVTWALENAIETADSMKSRGYGLAGRTAFSIYGFDTRDKRLLTWLLACGGYILTGWAVGGLSWRYFPSIQGVLTGVFSVSIQIVYLALCLTPLYLNWKEDRKWRSLQYKI